MQGVLLQLLRPKSLLTNLSHSTSMLSTKPVGSNLTIYPQSDFFSLPLLLPSDPFIICIMDYHDNLLIGLSASRMPISPKTQPHTILKITFKNQSPLAHFLIGSFIFLELSFRSCLYILRLILCLLLHLLLFSPSLRAVFSPCLQFPLLCKSF